MLLHLSNATVLKGTKVLVSVTVRGQKKCWHMESSPQVFISIGVVALVVLAGLKGFTFETGQIQRIASLENLRCALGLAKYRHPVLRTQGIELPANLENIDLKRLCHMQSDAECRSIALSTWQNKHEKAEVVAAKLLAGKVRLKRKKEIFEMLGAPSYKGLIPEQISFSKKTAQYGFTKLVRQIKGFLFSTKTTFVWMLLV